MAIKVKARLRVLAYLGKGFALVDQDGESSQVIKKPALLSGSEEGIGSDTILETTIALTKEQIAELVIQNNNSRKLVVILSLDDDE